MIQLSDDSNNSDGTTDVGKTNNRTVGSNVKKTKLVIHSSSSGEDNNITTNDNDDDDDNTGDINVGLNENIQTTVPNTR